MTKTKIEWANYWYDLGFSVVPVHYNLPNGGCSCHQGMDCPSPGKHPAPKSWQKFQNNRADKETLEFWFGGRFAEFNMGVVTGSISGNVFAVDVDIGEGKEGEDSLHDLQMQNDDLPETLAQVTGSGGKHYFFRAPKDEKIITGKNTLGPALDTRGEGGFVVVAPSNHKSGGNYHLNGAADFDIGHTGRFRVEASGGRISGGKLLYTGRLFYDFAAGFAAAVAEFESAANARGS
jgi:hypothetical protein